jgi:hypothetical protein
MEMSFFFRKKFQVTLSLVIATKPVSRPNSEVIGNLKRMEKKFQLLSYGAIFQRRKLRNVHVKNQLTTCFLWHVEWVMVDHLVHHRNVHFELKNHYEIVSSCSITRALWSLRHWVISFSNIGKNHIEM